MASSRGNSQRPRVLQWNANSLRRWHAELCLHLLQEDYDVLALQAVYMTAGALRLPGYVGYPSTTACILDSCNESPCLTAGHVQGVARCDIFVRTRIPHAVVPVDDLAGGAVECCWSLSALALATPQWPAYTSAPAAYRMPPAASHWQAT